MPRPSRLSECVDLVRKKEEFFFNHLCGALNTHTDPTIPPCYAVYSYSTVLYVYDYEACQWYGNKAKLTATSARHRDMLKPYSVAQWVDDSTISSIATQGIVLTTARRM